MELPLVRKLITGKALNQELYYENDEISENEDQIDEVEDLYKLLVKVKKQHPDV